MSKKKGIQENQPSAPLVEQARKLATEIDGELMAGFNEIESATGLKGAELIRQGLIRLIKEFRASGGEFSIQNLRPPVAG